MFLRLLAFVILALPHVLKAAPLFETVAEFARPGRTPLGRLVYVPDDGNYYGTTAAGGVYDRGTIFRITPAGNVTTLISFSGTMGPAKGESPIAGLVIGPDRALYGTTQAGGAGNFGTAFRITMAGAFSTLVEFTGSTGIARGSVPHELLSAPDGFFYGVTEGGGTMELGTVFRLSTNGLVTTLVDFTGTSGMRRGSSPVGALVLSGPDVLFGVTETGGAADLGTIYFVTTAGIWGLVGEFSGTTGSRRGSYPACGLAIHSDGALYGTTAAGGARDAGTVFRITTPGSYTLIREFSGSDGSQPAGALFSATDGALYGTTAGGGVDDLGTVFKVFNDGTTWVHSVITEFNGESGPVVGSTPEAGLIQGANGLMVGVTSAGGAGGYGTVFSLDATGSFAPVGNFTLPMGWRPSGGFVADTPADLLVPLYEGGSNGFGVVVRENATGAMSVDATFGDGIGRNPDGALVRAGLGFFGVTRGGGANARGTFFSHIPGVSTMDLLSFNLANGAKVEGPLTLAGDGYLYGVAREGGANSRGAIIRLSQDGSRTTLASFTGGMTGPFRGQTPRAPLAIGPDGILYGVTERGGLGDVGTLFSITTDGLATATLFDFASNGPRTPLAGLVAGPDGMFYGTTSLGGAAGAGTVFRFSVPNNFSVVAEFNGANDPFAGAKPAGALTVALDGALYGVTTQGGDYSQGTVFRISPTGTPTKLFAFTGIAGNVRGSEPLGSLYFAPDGLLHGATSSGGAGGGGSTYRIRQLGPHAGTDSPGFTPGSVILRSRVQTGGEPVAAWFEYGATASLGTTIPASGDPGNPSPVRYSAELSGFSPGSTIYFRARANNASGNSFGLVRSVVVPSPFDAWKLQYFGMTSVSATADSDGDGIPNLAEYGLLSLPNGPDQADSPKPMLSTYPEGLRLSTVVRRDPARTDVTVEVQAADSVSGPWTSLATSIGGNPFSGPGYVGGDSVTPGLKSVEVRDVVNVAEAPIRFLRVSVSLP